MHTFFSNDTVFFALAFPNVSVFILRRMHLFTNQLCGNVQGSLGPLPTCKKQVSTTITIETYLEC